MILDRTKAPEAHDIIFPIIPVTQEFRLSNGIDFTILNQGNQPVVLLEMVFPVGRGNEPVPGISYYVSKMLTEGTLRRTSEQIASVFDFYGSHLEISPTLDAVTIKLYTLNRFFPELAQVLLELIQDSIFPEKEFEVVKRIRVQQILQQHAKNNSFAGLKFREALFGDAHPYGEIITEEKAEQITIDDVRAFGKAFSVKPEIFLAGLVTDKEIQVVTDTFGQAVFDHKLESNPSQKPPKGLDVDIVREDSTQASIRYGIHTISRRHPEVHKLKITNNLFGGFFGSRLMKNIREEKGLTYGIHSSLIHLQEASYWQVGTEVLRDKVDLVKEEIAKEIKQLQETPPSPNELHTVISYMKGKLLTTFDTPFNAIHTIKDVKLNGLGMDYFEDYRETLATITPEDICEMATKYFDSGNATSVTVK